MLDPKFLGERLDELKQALERRNASPDSLLEISRLASERKALIHKTETLKSDRNRVSQEIAGLKAKSKSDPEAAKQADSLVVQMRGVGDEIKLLDEKLMQLQEKLDFEALRIPNIPQSVVPAGAGAEDNQEVKKWGKIRDFGFEPADHVTLGEKLGILDFERATKMSGARFALYLGAGATLERALIQFMLDTHTREHGYREAIPPFMVNRLAMTATGNLPKFEEDLFKTGLADREMFLIPTSEVPLTNIRRDEILESQELPLYFTAYSPCFRSEAGSHGRDTRGLIRQHQFQKVELVKITSQEQSEQEHAKMVRDAERILELLELPYRTMLLCSGDMSFSSSKTYDLEVWLPSQKTYREISSCSNCWDFQARRAQIRYRAEAGAKPQLAHTLNGSGLAVGRTWIAILENYQDKEGNVQVPKVLHRYVDGAPGFVKKDGEIWMRRGG
jgi:seryl-tRNA synthetase